MPLTVDDLLALPSAELFAIIERAAPLDPEVVADSSYTGIDLSMPRWFHKLFWRTFRKTFYLDPETEVIRGWNVKVEQTGWAEPPEPKRDRHGFPLTFGHYELRSARGLRFPRGWQGEHYLDYGVAGNRFADFPARAGYCPLVAVNPGSSDLLLGWEVFKVGGLLVPIRDYWVLCREGDLRAEDVVPRPVPERVVGALPEQVGA